MEEDSPPPPSQGGAQPKKTIPVHIPYMPDVENSRLSRAVEMSVESTPVTRIDAGLRFALRTYTIEFQPNGPSCSCPDGMIRRRFACKHILFILIIFLGFDRSDVASVDFADVRAAIDRLE